MPYQPFLPDRPPGALEFRCPFLPGFGIEEALAFAADAELEGPARVARFIDDADVVAAAGQGEGQLGRIALQVQLVDRAPRSDVVGHGGDGEHRAMDVADRNGTSTDHVLALEEFVVHVEPAQDFGVLAIGHARSVGIPGHQVEHGFAMSEVILANHLRPDQVGRLEQLKATGHLLVAKIALLPHHVLEQGDFTGVHEDVDFADVGEVGHRRKQGDARQTIVTVASHRRRDNGQQDAAKAVANRVNLAFGQDLGNGVERGHRSRLAVVFHAQIAVFGPRVEPRDHEYRMPTVDEVFDQRIVR